jgi:GNAT superfamily N-acetyltransferase
MLEITTADAVRTAGKGDERAVLSSLTLAFSTDPAARWLYPDPHQFLTHFPEFARAFGGRAFEHGSAYMTEGYCGAALWLPPGVQPDDQTIWELVERTASPPIQSDMAGIFEQMASYHPREPHWYLPLIGVEPAYQNRGYGAALLRRALEVCDREGLPAYLESSNPMNIPLYERHGFRTIGTIQAGSSPALYPMLRPPVMGR